MAGISVDGNKKVRRFLICDRGSSLQRNEGVVLAGVNDFGPKPGSQQFAQSPAHVENQILFLQTVGTDRASIVASVAGIDNDFPNLQSKGADQGTVTASGRLGFADVKV